MFKVWESQVELLVGGFGKWTREPFRVADLRRITFSCGRDKELAMAISEPLDEVPLAGGRITKGVVRIGNTVRRPSKPMSGAVSCLLRHLEKKDFGGVQRYLGTDGHGTDVLSYILGYVPLKWQFFPDETIEIAGKLLRAFHDATLGSELLQEEPVICHNDPGPNNVVFQDGRPIAFIDFDMMARGKGLDDLGYMGWSWCISSKLDRQPVSIQARQIGVLASSYGIDSTQRHDLFNSIVERQLRNIEFWRQKKDSSDCDRNTEKVEEMIEWSTREHAHTLAHRAVFLSALD
jgi:hypothetical protein